MARGRQGEHERAGDTPVRVEAYTGGDGPVGVLLCHDEVQRLASDRGDGEDG